MRLLLLALIALVVVPVSVAKAQPVVVTVTRQSNGFIADFVFPRPAPAWGFFRSSPAANDGRSWRLQSWQVLTPGVALQRRGKFDALVSTNGRPVPPKVRVQLQPFTGHLVADYVPALRLGGDSVALFDGHFATFSVDSAAKLDRLPVALDATLVGDSGTSLKFRGGSLRLAGDVQGYRAGNSEGTYGLFDVPRASVRNGVATVIDGEMPQWIADDLTAYAPRVFELLSRRLGPSGIAEPTFLAAWEGGAKDGASFNGGTLKGLVLMRFEGKSALKQLPALTDLAHWFIAHEASHFWLGQSVRYTTQFDSWIMEGGADLLAMRTAQQLDPRFNGSKKINESLVDCLKLAGRPVATALERDEYRAYYACGGIFALVAEKANGGDFYDFTRKLIAANQGDHELTAAEWYAALDRASGSRKLSTEIRALVEKGSPDPKTALTTLLRDAGIAYTLNAKGDLQLQ